jgi:hypothetical protein
MAIYRPCDLSDCTRRPGLFSSRYFDGGQAIPKGVNV